MATQRMTTEQAIKELKKQTRRKLSERQMQRYAAELGVKQGGTRSPYEWTKTNIKDLIRRMGLKSKR